MPIYQCKSIAHHLVSSWLDKVRLDFKNLGFCGEFAIVEGKRGATADCVAIDTCTHIKGSPLDSPLHHLDFLQTSMSADKSCYHQTVR